MPSDVFTERLIFNNGAKMQIDWFTVLTFACGFIMGGVAHQFLFN